MNTTWLLIICIHSRSLHATDSYSYIRFNSKTACERKADEINNEKGMCLNDACTAWEGTGRDAECVKDSPSEDK